MPHAAGAPVRCADLGWSADVRTTWRRSGGTAPRKHGEAPKAAARLAPMRSGEHAQAATHQFRIEDHDKGEDIAMLRLARGLFAVTLLAAVFAGSALGTADPAYGTKSHFNCNGNKGSTNCQNGVININVTGVSSNDSDYNVTLVKMGDVVSNIDIDVKNVDIKLIDTIKVELEKVGIKVCEIKVQIGLKNINKNYC
jgi:hypothetical protein